MEGKMTEVSLFEQLQQQAGLGGAKGLLATEMLEFYNQYTQGSLSKEEYQYLMDDIAKVRSQQELAEDEMACRWFAAAAGVMFNMV